MTGGGGGGGYVQGMSWTLGRNEGIPIYFLSNQTAIPIRTTPALLWGVVQVTKVYAHLATLPHLSASVWHSVSMVTTYCDSCVPRPFLALGLPSRVYFWCCNWRARPLQGFYHNFQRMHWLCTQSECFVKMSSEWNCFSCQVVWVLCS